jgi:hypothetical protein
MATPWDDVLKLLVQTSPQAFIDGYQPGSQCGGGWAATPFIAGRSAREGVVIHLTSSNRDR